MIEINNLTSASIDKDFLRKVGQKVLEKENKKKAKLSVALIKEKEIRQLNKRYLGKDQATDVLAFPETKYLKKKFKTGDDVLGEIVICPQVVKKNANKFNSPFEKELCQVLIHGILHLLGYNHEKSVREAEKMEEKENYYLDKYFVKSE